MFESKLVRLSPILLTFSGILLFFSLYLTGSVWPLYLQEKQFDSAAIGLIMGLYGFTLIFSRIPIGLLADSSHGKRRWLIAAGFLAVSVGMVLSLGDSALLLGLGRVLMGVGAGFYVPVVILFTAFYPASSLTKSMGRTASFFGIGQILAHPLGGFLADYTSWEMAFWASSILGLAGAALVLLIKEPKIASAGPLILPPGKKTLFLSSILMAVSFFVVFATAYTLTPIYADSILNVSKTVQGALLSAYLTVFVVVVVQSYRLADKFGIFPTSALGLSALGLSALFVPGADLPRLFFCEVLLGIGLGLTWGPLMAMSVSDIEPKLRFGAMGIFQSVYAVGMFLGPAVSGMVAQYFKMEAAFYLNAVVATIAVCYIIINQAVKKPLNFINLIHLAKKPDS